MTEGSIFVGIGGWDYEPWRGTFYPPGLAKTKQLEYAAGRLTATEINATYYKLQSPDLFARWAKVVPDGFRFAVKASRFCTNRKVLAEGAEAIARFCGQGLTELGDKLGPILWQFMGTKQFDPEDFGAFLKLLPKSWDGVPLRHAVEPRHESFRTPEFVAMARAAGVAIVFADADDYPCIADLSGDFSYARLQRCREEEATGYDAAALDRWAAIANSWSRGESPVELPYVADTGAKAQSRDTYIFFISGAKVRAPAAATSLIERL
ncbi:DUF72 domain-containing protein [Sphingosinicella rhizophila]|uniref:DUF72 domain-containing protein n=1 Tax=Sphingosinicella rhizophila TaxID=3050082 RepID=A0ABU3Q4C3_9SPHN|nr:DUF72 domain-containing protein [Sphingosinicella sp. GR2756]MDT9598265.1 DUF72 domain-containing protein [Sphingosinicella sp. GR2756]